MPKPNTSSAKHMKQGKASANIAIHSKFYTKNNAEGDTQLYDETAQCETFGGWLYSLAGAALCGLLVAKHVPALMNLAGMLTLLALAITYALSCGLLTAWLALPAPEKK